MQTHYPASPRDLADALATADQARQPIHLGGAFSKRRLGGPIPESAVTISTAKLNRILQYNSADLTLSVEAGVPYAELQATLAKNGQMLPLDPPFAAQATIGGVIAANCSGPRRRLHGAARDIVIGMQIAGLDGKITQSGGMVVKNVAGLDTGKLHIGALGTLGAIAVLNFKLLPLPVATRTFVKSFDTAGDAVAARDALLQSILQPLAIDLVNPAAAAALGLAGHCLLVEAGGTPRLLDRYERELAGYRVADAGLWSKVTGFTETFLAQHVRGCVVRISTQLQDLGTVLAKFNGPLIARAASGVAYAYCDQPPAFLPPFPCVVEYSPDPRDAALPLWPNPGPDLALMTKIKQMLDPHELLNKGRYYGRI
jgi:glycolate oxidase FAD binding subunit